MIWLALLIAMGISVIVTAGMGWERAGIAGVVFAPAIPLLLLWFAAKTIFKAAISPRWSR